MRKIVRITIPLFITEGNTMEENLRKHDQFIDNIREAHYALEEKLQEEHIDRMMHLCIQHLKEICNDSNTFVRPHEIENYLRWYVMHGHYDIYPWESGQYANEKDYIIKSGIEYVKSAEYLREFQKRGNARIKCENQLNIDL